MRKGIVIKLLKYIILTIAFFIVLVGIYFLFAFFLSRLSIEGKNQNKDVRVYILSNGVHTDWVVPIKYKNIDLSKIIPYSHTKSKDTTMNYLAFGWGDKGFYLETPTWDDLRFLTAFNAAFGLSESAMHTTFYKKIKESDLCISIYLSEENYVKLLAYILNSFDYSSDGNVIKVDSDYTYGKNDSFYEAKGRYSLFKTCNSWTNKGLKESYSKSCVWSPFQSGIFYQYRNEF